ncbi:Tc5 transposase DNA-binding domain [Popillia japonica]|uniref:Tc5 transposase DNA-binding domain n=1 Tax=Popillia japonica TaxID=7064 RepID=A0AAW1LHR9_POPJA
MPRKDLTLQTKIAILDKIKNQPANTSQRKLAELTGIQKSTISHLIQQENQLRNEWTLQQGKAKTSKRKRDGEDPDVEEALDQWFSLVTERGVCISGPVLTAKSKDLAGKLGHNNLKATDRWLSRWKVRHGIKFKKMHGADTVMAEEWKTRKLLLLSTIFVQMTYTIPMKPVSATVLHQMAPYFINTLNYRDTKKQWIALQCYVVHICQVLTNANFSSIELSVFP